MKNTDLKNPNNGLFWQAKGYKERPKNWKELLPSESKRQQNREKYHSECGPDGRGSVDAMFDTLCEEDY